MTWKEKKVVLEQTGDFSGNSSVEFTVSTPKKAEFTLNFLIPSWSKKVDVYINGEKIPSRAFTMSYLTINREWRNKDQIKLVFYPDFYTKEMPDDPNVIALFYGPDMLAFETSSEVILKGTQAEIRKGLGKDNGRFYLFNNGRTYPLCRLSEVGNQSYGVYATIREW